MVERNKRFVYGTFHWPGSESGMKPPPRPPTWGIVRTLDPWDQVAIEILREYGANELIGKMYYKGGNQWVPMEPRLATEAQWYMWFHKLPELARSSAQMYYFDMDGSGRWVVLHFRTESDETGPYVAVALKYAGA